MKTTEFEEKILKEFRRSDFCFDNYGVGRSLHTNKDVTPEVEQFLLKAIRDAREEAIREAVEKTYMQCGGGGDGDSGTVIVNRIIEDLITNSH